MRKLMKDDQKLPMASAAGTFQQCMERRQLAEQQWPPALLVDKKQADPSECGYAEAGWQDAVLQTQFSIMYLPASAGRCSLAGTPMGGTAGTGPQLSPWSSR